jgi:succinoglycan biosynthesis protein ExoM
MDETAIEETRMDDVTAVQKPRIVVAVCTYRRNDPLQRLLDALLRNQDRLGDCADVGVVIADDNDDGRARSVADAYRERFRLGVTYRHVGSGNISTARNATLDEALPLSDWVAMTDDDCVPVDGWLGAMLAVQRATGADAVTGRCELCADDDAPSWITDEPFLTRGEFRFDDGDSVPTAGTNNSFLRSAFFRERPDIRFREDLGETGGEDMVFFRQAHARGLSIRYAADAVVFGVEDPDRTTLTYQIRSHYWLGNTEFVTNSMLGRVNRLRWLARSLKLALQAMTRPARRLWRREPPQYRYALALLAHASGMALGALGVRLRHY